MARDFISESGTFYNQTQHVHDEIQHISLPIFHIILTVVIRLGRYDTRFYFQI